MTTRNIKTCKCQCVQAAREMQLPIPTALDVFEGEPTKLILAVSERVMELNAEALDSGEDFDPVKYVTGAARKRGWGVYGYNTEAKVELGSLADTDIERIRTMLEERPERVAEYLAAAASQHERAKNKQKQEAGT